MGKENLHEANWIVLLISLLINFTFIIIYVVEAIKGQRGWATVFIFIGILFITYGGTLRLYFKDKSHPKIKYSTLYSFIIVYLYTMVTFKYALTFIFIFISVVLYLMYLDYKIIRTIYWMTLASSTLRVLHMYFVLEYRWQNTVAEYSVQIGGIVLTSMGLIWSTTKILRSNNKKVNRVQKVHKVNEVNQMLTPQIQENICVEGL